MQEAENSTAVCILPTDVGVRVSNRSIKIIFVIDSLGRGGAQRQLVEILKHLPSAKFQVEVIALSDEKIAYAQELRENRIPLTIIPHTGKWSWRTLVAVYKKIKLVRPDIVHAWLFTSGLYGRLAAFLAGVPHILYAMRNTIDDMRTPERLVDRLFLPFTEVVTANAEAIRPGLRSLGVPDSKIRVIYNGIDLAKFPVKVRRGYDREWNIPASSPTVAMVARMSWPKDYETFLKAAARVIEKRKDAYFVLIGDGAQRAQVEKMIDVLSLRSHVRMLGERADVWSILQEFDLYVLSSFFEGFSNVIMEAMTAAKPVIACNVGGNTELVMDGSTGLIVPVKDPERLAGAIMDLLADTRRAAQMGRAGRKRIEENFAIEKTTAAMGALFEELVAGNGERGARHGARIALWKQGFRGTISTGFKFRQTLKD